MLMVVLMPLFVVGQATQAPVFKGSYSGQNIYQFIEQYIISNDIDYDEVSAVAVSFMIDAQGQVSSIELLDEANSQLQAQVTQFIEATSGYWEPAYKAGEPVDFLYRMSVRFMPQAEEMRFAIYQFKKGLRHLKHQNWTKAKICFDRCEDVMPGHGGVNYIQIVACYFNGNQDQAMSRFIRLKENQPELSNSLLSMGERYAFLSE